MRIVTFNVNGIRSMSKKNKEGKLLSEEKEEVGLCQLVREQEVDILCLQEIKTQSEGDLDFLRRWLPYGDVCCCTRKKGYSGVALLSRIQPEWISYGFDLFHEERMGLYQGWVITEEGRLVTAKFAEMVVVTVYVPNAQPDLVRLGERERWDSLVRAYLRELRREFGLPVVICGDWNVALEDRDIHRKQPKGTAGCSPSERAGFQAYLEDGWVDAFRWLYPDAVGPETYTYWSNFSRAREKGKAVADGSACLSRTKGWRIDGFLVSEDLKGLIREVRVLQEYGGSDHGAVMMELEVGQM
jgi:exodeoxyribonuclease-3